VKPSRTRTRFSIGANAVIAVAAVALLLLADNGALRFGMILVLISAVLGIALAVYQARRAR
jgi:uncharacterized membrane protein